MSETGADPTPLVENEKPVNAAEQQATEVGTPTKRTPKRKGDAFKKESEELLKTLGVSLDMEDGRRRTRSSARGGTPTTAPVTPPAKRARGSTTPKVSEDTKSPSTATTPKKRGAAIQGERKRLLVLMDPALPKEYTDNAKEAADENDEMDSTEPTASTVVEKVDGGNTQEVTETKNAEDKHVESAKEGEKENDLNKEDDAKKEEEEVVSVEQTDDVKDATDVTAKVTAEPVKDAVAKEADPEPVKEPANDKEEHPTTADNAQNKDGLEEKKPEEPMEVDVEQEQSDNVEAAKETKSDDTKKDELVEAVCETNGNNSNTTPKKSAEPEVIKPDAAEKVCPESSNEQQATTIKPDSTVVETAPPPAEETKVEENNSTTQEEKGTTPVKNVAETKEVEKVVTPVEVSIETKIVTSEEATATTIEPSPTPE